LNISEIVKDKTLVPVGNRMAWHGESNYHVTDDVTKEKVNPDPNTTTVTGPVQVLATVTHKKCR